MANSEESIYENNRISYSKIAKEYSQKHVSENSARLRISKFVENISSDGLILDLGCGHGRDMKIFEDLGFKAIGVDNCKELLVEARRKTGLELVEMDIINLDFPNDFFDGVWASAVLHHLLDKDIIIVLMKIKDVLKKGGKLFISVRANYENIWDEEYGMDKRYYNNFNLIKLKNLVEEAGFIVESLEFYENKDKSWLFCNCLKSLNEYN